MKKGFFLFEADIFCEEALINELVSCRHHNIIVVDKYTPEMDGTVLELTEEDIVKEMYLKRHQGEGFSYYQKFKTVNFYKIGKAFSQEYFMRRLGEHIKSSDLNSYYELIFEEALNKGFKFKAIQTGNLKWWEIDTPEDYRKTKEIFNIK